MGSRLNYYNFCPEIFEKFIELEALLRKTSLESGLIHMVKIRASQINGCAFCVDMHVKEAVIDGERHLKLHHIVSWEESNLFSKKERAALRWTEALTQLSVANTKDGIYDQVKKKFSDKEMVELTAVVSMINVWNRFAVAFRAEPGTLDKKLGLDKAEL